MLPPCGAAGEASAAGSGKSAETAAHMRRLRIDDPLKEKPAFSNESPTGVPGGHFRSIQVRFPIDGRTPKMRLSSGERAAKWTSVAARRGQRTSNRAAKRGSGLGTIATARGRQ